MTIDVSNNNPRIEYAVADGVVQTVFAVPFDFFEDSDLSIYVDGVLKSEGSDYTITGGDGSTGTVTFVTATPPEVQQVTGASGGSTVVIARHVSLERVTDFVAGQDINRAALNTQLDTIVAQIADLDDKVDRTIHLTDSEVPPSMLLTSDRKGRVLAFDSVTGDVEAGPLSNDIQIIADNISEILAADDEAAAAAASATAAAASASAGASSASAAASSAASASASETAAETAQTAAETAESNAATSEANAATSETNAATSATNAATSATEAETAKNGAETARDAALAALDSFDDRYLGVKTSDPTVDNDGDALAVGAIYFNSTTDLLYVYNGTSWQVTANAASGDLVSTNNLSDLTSPATARTNLGLGTNDSPTFAGLTTTANVSFGDNDKATFGDGNDLQIFHSGATSYIRDVGDGDLQLFATDDVYIRGYATNNYMARFNENGAVTLYHNNAPKLATTSTGIDVTGTVTADGLTVDGTISTGGTSRSELIDKDLSFYENNYYIGSINATSADNINGLTIESEFNGDILFKGSAGGTGGSKDAAVKRLFIDGATGDISFYEDTGTTPKFFWDASAERLGIGTSSPSEALTVVGNGVFGNATTKYNTLTINGGHVGDGDNDYGITINSFEPAITLLDRSTGAGSGQMRVQSDGAFWFIRDSTNDGTIGHTSNTTDSVIAKLEADGTVRATSFAGDGSSLTGIAAGAGGGGNDEIFWENGQNVTTNYTITNGKNAMSAGPITINSGVTVTVGAGETWTVV